MLNHIPTYVIAGALGAGKTRFIQDLLTHKPAHEHWAVLINEFGQIGLDAALLGASQQGISISEIAGGCLCCINGAPFEVGLARLLRKAKPDRLLIEPSGLAHPHTLINKLSQGQWQSVLRLAPGIMVLDATQPNALNEAQQAFLVSAQQLVLSKAETLSDPAREALAQGFSGKVIHWRYLEPLPLNWFHEAPANPEIVDKVTGLATAQIALGWAGDKYCAINQTAEGVAIGWRFSPTYLFDAKQVVALLSGLKYVRAKLVIHSAEGWLSANLTGSGALEWQPSLWRKDSRIELICTQAVDKEALDSALMGTLVRGV